MGIIHNQKKKPNGINQADKNARKSDDLLQRNFLADSPFTKCIAPYPKEELIYGRYNTSKMNVT